MKRRTFIQAMVAGGAVSAFGGLGINLSQAAQQAEAFKLDKTTITTSICCYCAVGCGILVWSNPQTKRAVNIEGDPDHPTNGGTLCPKGASIWQTTENPRRVTSVLYRAPGSSQWEEKSWEWALPRIAQKIKASRDKGFETKNAKGQTVNRTTAIASVGSAALDTEEGWLYQAILRSLGVVYLESHARI